MKQLHTADTPASASSPPPHLRDPASELAKSTFRFGIALLPVAVRADTRDLYFLLRTLDDLVDEHHPQAEERVAAVERWAHGQSADSPETRTLSRLSRRYPLSREAVIDFCAGMRHDLERALIKTESDLDLYCHQAGGSIAVMLATLLGTTRPLGELELESLGRAAQRTNILRDIDEDLANGHVYIPRDTIARYGFPEPGAREALLKDHIARADALYEEGLSAISLLARGRRAVTLSAVLYREILRQIEHDGYGRESGRATIPAWRETAIVRRYRESFHEAGRPAAGRGTHRRPYHHNTQSKE